VILTDAVTSLLAKWDATKVAAATTDAVAQSQKSLLSLGAIWHHAKTQVDAKMAEYTPVDGGDKRKQKADFRQKAFSQVLGMSLDSFFTLTGLGQSSLDKAGNAYANPVLRPVHHRIGPAARAQLVPLLTHSDETADLVADDGTATPELQDLIDKVVARESDAGAQLAIVREYRKARDAATKAAQDAATKAAAETKAATATAPGQKGYKGPKARADEKKAGQLAKANKMILRCLLLRDIADRLAREVEKAPAPLTIKDAQAFAGMAKAATIAANPEFATILSTFNVKDAVIEMMS